MSLGNSPNPHSADEDSSTATAASAGTSADGQATDVLWSADTTPKRPHSASLREMARYWWRQLTSMRTALILLFLLALASVPGSLLPQKSLSQSKVNDYLAQHRTLGPWLDRLGFFDVFSAPWYAAIYLLLFISLVGCLTPRIAVYWKALRSAPPPAPRRLRRIGEYASASIDADLTDTADAVKSILRKGRWRVIRRTGGDGTITLSAEKGYLREAGNLIFHLSLLALLASLAVGKLNSYEGSRIALEGEGFCNQQQSYDSFRSGELAGGADMVPICLDLHTFTTTYDANLTPAKFASDVSWTVGAGGNTHTATIGVNDPLRADGVRVYVTGHGYAPVFTVTMPDGTVRKNVTAPFLPTDQVNFGSEGAIKLDSGDPEKQLAFEGFLAPTAVNTDGAIASADPRLLNPQVALVVYQGYTGLDSGVPQSVYTLDKSLIKDGLLKKAAAKNLAPGESLQLPDGTTVTFDKVIEWAAFQVSRDPGQVWVLLSSLVLLIAITASLMMRRRRLWVRLTPGRGGHGRIEVGGLAHTQPAAFTREFTTVSTRILHRDSTDPMEAP